MRKILKWLGKLLISLPLAIAVAAFVLLAINYPALLWCVVRWPSDYYLLYAGIVVAAIAIISLRKLRKQQATSARIGLAMTGLYFLVLLYFGLQALLWPALFIQQRPASNTGASISAEASAYLASALEIMEKHALNRSLVNWSALKGRAWWLAKGAQTPADTYFAISYTLLQLGDNHSFFVTPDQREKSGATRELPAVTVQRLDGKLGYLSIPQCSVQTTEDMAAFATNTQKLISELDAQGVCGWIVDLRKNGGGNMWPMIAGVGPVLGEGELGRFAFPDGSTLAWRYQDGNALLGDEVQAAASPPAYKPKSTTPVAVLIGDGTASSGEAVAVSFRGRPQTRFFGQKSYGLSTSNRVFEMSDSARIVLTTSVLQDRTGKNYGAKIAPDEYTDADQTIAAAQRWLKTHSDCDGD